MRENGKLLEFQPSSAVAERLRILGQTEDVKFSPNQDRLAIAGLTENKILVIDIRPVARDGVRVIESEACVEITCDAFVMPHGVAWIDDHTLIVANRERGLVVISVPPCGPQAPSVRAEPLLDMVPAKANHIQTPGAVAVMRLGDGLFDILSCNNSSHHVSRHRLQRKERFEVIEHDTFLGTGFQIPDGVTVSDDAGLIAISNHYAKRVDVFPNRCERGTHAQAICSLAKHGYPHGVRFAAGDRLLLTADAGRPYVHVFRRGGDRWGGTVKPALSIRVIGEEAFKLGHTNDEEGGPKGLDVSGDGSFFVVSCQAVPIAFFAFAETASRLLAKPAAASSAGWWSLLMTSLGNLRRGQPRFRKSCGLMHAATSGPGRNLPGSSSDSRAITGPGSAIRSGYDTSTSVTRSLLASTSRMWRLWCSCPSTRCFFSDRCCRPCRASIANCESTTCSAGRTM